MAALPRPVLPSLTLPWSCCQGHVCLGAGTGQEEGSRAAGRQELGFGDAQAKAAPQRPARQATE